jgi:hypothetical protein
MKQKLTTKEISIFGIKSSPLKPLNQIKANLAGMVPFQYCVRQRRPPFKMAAVTKNRNFFSCQFLLHYKSK